MDAKILLERLRLGNQKLLLKHLPFGNQQLLVLLERLPLDKQQHGDVLLKHLPSGRNYRAVDGFSRTGGARLGLLKRLPRNKPQPLLRVEQSNSGKSSPRWFRKLDNTFCKFDNMFLGTQ